MESHELFGALDLALLHAQELGGGGRLADVALCLQRRLDGRGGVRIEQHRDEHVVVVGPDAAAFSADEAARQIVGEADRLLSDLRIAPLPRTLGRLRIAALVSPDVARRVGVLPELVAERHAAWSGDALAACADPLDALVLAGRAADAFAVAVAAALVAARRGVESALDALVAGATVPPAAAKREVEGIARLVTSRQRALGARTLRALRERPEASSLVRALEGLPRVARCLADDAERLRRPLDEALARRLAAHGAGATAELRAALAEALLDERITRADIAAALARCGADVDELLERAWWPRPVRAVLWQLAESSIR